MKITGPADNNPFKKDQISGANKAAATKAASAASAASANQDIAATPQGATAASEKVLVSDAGMEIAKVQGQLKKTPDIRADKVKALKSQIASGSYFVSSDKIAGKIVEDIVKNG